MSILSKLHQKIIESRSAVSSAGKFATNYAGKAFVDVGTAASHAVRDASNAAGHAVRDAGQAAGQAVVNASAATGKAAKNVEQAVEKYWKKLGPGLTTGAADDDPSGIATYSQAGAQTGLGFTWLALFTYPLMAVVQEMCARIGLVTNRGLAGNIRLYFPKWMLYIVTFLLVAANTFNIGADLGAMAEAARLLVPQISFVALIIAFTLVSLYLQIFTSYKTYAKYLKWLALILFSYVLTSFAVDLDWSAIARATFIPHMEFNKESILLVSAILGTTISPYLFFWQTSQEVEEKALHISQSEMLTATETNTVAISGNTNAAEIKDMRVDVWSGMFISNLVMFFIVIVCSATLFANGITDIKTAADAANALRPLAGDLAYLLFAVGIIGTGLLAVPILAGSTSYAIAESFRFVSGLHYKFKEAYAFYGVIILSMVVGLGLNFIGLDPIKALIYSAIANCIVAPLVLIFIVMISSDRKVMGKYANKPLTTAIGWLVTALMLVVAGVTIWALI